MGSLYLGAFQIGMMKESLQPALDFYDGIEQEWTLAVDRLRQIVGTGSVLEIKECRDDLYDVLRKIKNTKVFDSSHTYTTAESWASSIKHHLNESKRYGTEMVQALLTTTTSNSDLEMLLTKTRLLKQDVRAKMAEHVAKIDKALDQFYVAFNDGRDTITREIEALTPPAKSAAVGMRRTKGLSDIQIMRMQGSFKPAMNFFIKLSPEWTKALDLLRQWTQLYDSYGDRVEPTHANIQKGLDALLQVVYKIRNTKVFDSQGSTMTAEAWPSAVEKNLVESSRYGKEMADALYVTLDLSSKLERMLQANQSFDEGTRKKMADMWSQMDKACDEFYNLLSYGGDAIEAEIAGLAPAQPLSPAERAVQKAIATAKAVVGYSTKVDAPIRKSYLSKSYRRTKSGPLTPEQAEEYLNALSDNLRTAGYPGAGRDADRGSFTAGGIRGASTVYIDVNEERGVPTIGFVAEYVNNDPSTGADDVRTRAKKLVADVAATLGLSLTRPEYYSILKRWQAEPADDTSMVAFATHDYYTPTFTEDGAEAFVESAVKHLEKIEAELAQAGSMNGFTFNPFKGGGGKSITGAKVQTAKERLPYESLRAAALKFSDAGYPVDGPTQNRLRVTIGAISETSSAFLEFYRATRMPVFTYSLMFEVDDYFETPQALEDAAQKLASKAAHMTANIFTEPFYSDKAGNSQQAPDENTAWVTFEADADPRSGITLSMEGATGFANAAYNHLIPLENDIRGMAKGLGFKFIDFGGAGE